MKFLNVGTMVFDPNDCVMGLFAMRCKYLKSFHFLEELNEKNPSAEVQFCNYIRSLKDCKIYSVDYLYATFCFADDWLITDLQMYAFAKNGKSMAKRQAPFNLRLASVSQRYCRGYKIFNSLGTRVTKSRPVADWVPFCHAFSKSI